MRVGISTVHTPGIYGGAEFLVDGLARAVREAGYSVHRINAPFFFQPVEAAEVTMNQCKAIDYVRFAGAQIDKMICLKFPAYFMQHPDKRVWLLHQHRPAYDLYGSPHGWTQGNAATDALRERIIAEDQIALSGESEGSARAVFTIAERVCQRLKSYNNLPSRALYHPPSDHDAFCCEETLPYIFVPSRLEALKRQDLFLRALARCKTPINAVFAGSGGMLEDLQQLAEELQISDRVRFVGAVDRAEMIKLYANALAVFFGPLDEDYGYVTLEAMLSAKPVITCKDSGGPLEFVLDRQTGFVNNPEPDEIAENLENLVQNTAKARELGQAGLEHYNSMNINWNSVVETLLADLPDNPQNSERSAS